MKSTSKKTPLNAIVQSKKNPPKFVCSFLVIWYDFIWVHVTFWGEKTGFANFQIFSTIFRYFFDQKTIKNGIILTFQIVIWNIKLIPFLLVFWSKKYRKMVEKIWKFSNPVFSSQNVTETHIKSYQDTRNEQTNSEVFFLLCTIAFRMLFFYFVLFIWSVVSDKKYIFRIV